MSGDVFGCHTGGEGGPLGTRWHLRRGKLLCLLRSLNQPVVQTGKTLLEPPGPSPSLARPQLPVCRSPCLLCGGGPCSGVSPECLLVAVVWFVGAVSRRAPGPPGPRLPGGRHCPILNPSRSPCVSDHCRSQSVPWAGLPPCSTSCLPVLSWRPLQTPYGAVGPA